MVALPGLPGGGGGAPSFTDSFKDQSSAIADAGDVGFGAPFIVNQTPDVATVATNFGLPLLIGGGLVMAVLLLQRRGG